MRNLKYQKDLSNFVNKTIPSKEDFSKLQFKKNTPLTAKISESANRLIKLQMVYFCIRVLTLVLTICFAILVSYFPEYDNFYGKKVRANGTIAWLFLIFICIVIFTITSLVTSQLLYLSFFRKDYKFIKMCAYKYLNNVQIALMIDSQKNFKNRPSWWYFRGWAPFSSGPFFVSVAFIPAKAKEIFPKEKFAFSFTKEYPFYTMLKYLTNVIEKGNDFPIDDATFDMLKWNNLNGFYNQYISETGSFRGEAELFFASEKFKQFLHEDKHA